MAVERQRVCAKALDGGQQARSASCPSGRSSSAAAKRRAGGMPGGVGPRSGEPAGGLPPKRRWELSRIAWAGTAADG